MRCQVRGWGGVHCPGSVSKIMPHYPSRILACLSTPNSTFTVQGLRMLSMRSCRTLVSLDINACGLSQLDLSRMAFVR